MGQVIGTINGYAYKWTKGEWDIVCTTVRVTKRLGEGKIDNVECVEYLGEDKKHYAVTLAASHAVEQGHG